MELCMPLALFALTISAFAIGTTEFVIVGTVPTIASTTGYLVTFRRNAGFNLCAGCGYWRAGASTALTGRLPRKRLLVALMVLFTAGNFLLAWQAQAI